MPGEIKVKRNLVLAIVVLVLVMSGAYFYISMISGPTTAPYAPPSAPAPTPGVTPTPQPTPTETPVAQKPTVSDVLFEDITGYRAKVLVVNVGDRVKAHVNITTQSQMSVAIMIEWVKENAFWPDEVVATYQKNVDLASGTTDVKFDQLTSLKGAGKYFVRVYYWDGSQWVRIDPWNSAISNPGRPYVEFKEVAIPTPTPTPSIPTPTPTPAIPTPTPTPPPLRTPTPPPPTPTPSPTPSAPEISFIGVQFRDSSGNTGSILTVKTGDQVSAIVSVRASSSMNTYIKIEWVKDVPYGSDQIAMSDWKQVSLSAGTNTITFTGLTSTLGEGKYFVRVYKWENGNWVRIDPWTSPFSNPDRPYVEFKEPSVTLSDVKFQYGSTIANTITAPSGSTVSAHVYLTSTVSTSVYIKIEWVKNVKWWTDQVASEYQKLVTLNAGSNDVVFDGLTDTLGSGNYFVRVYKWDGSSWVRIDPWNSETGRPSVTFQ